MTPRRHALTPAAAILDRRLLGALPTFRDPTSWFAWLVFLKAAYGEPMTADEIACFLRHTGRSRYAPPHGGYPENVAIVGRQSGKTQIGSAIGDTEAAGAANDPALADTAAILVAQDHRGAMRTTLRYAVTPFERVPVLRNLVTNQTADTLTLTNGVLLTAYPCRPAAVRGLRAAVVVADEVAFYRNSEGNPVDVEMLRAVRPTLATTGGKLFILSSPYAQSGALYELHRKHFGRDDSPVLVWQATAPEMNPTLPGDYLARMAEDDPEAYRSEVLGEFRTGVATFLDPDALAACVAEHVRERAPSLDHVHSAFTDSASGTRGRDRWSLGIAHPEGEHVVLDLIRAWTPPFNPSGVIAEAAAILTTYNIPTVTGDRFAPGFVAEAFRAHGIDYVPSPLDRSALYLELLPLINARLAVLLDVPEMLREFRGLERHRGSSGRDRVDHRPGAHDDFANSAAGALLLARALGEPVDLGPSEEELLALRTWALPSWISHDAL